jgi:hypothetical protein
VVPVVTIDYFIVLIVVTAAPITVATVVIIIYFTVVTMVTVLSMYTIVVTGYYGCTIQEMALVSLPPNKSIRLTNCNQN